MVTPLQLLDINKPLNTAVANTQKKKKSEDSRVQTQVWSRFLFRRQGGRHPQAYIFKKKERVETNK